MAHKDPALHRVAVLDPQLEPGDIVATAPTPWPQPVHGRDKIELEIDGIGKLAFNVKDELKRTWERRTRLQMHEQAAQKDRRRLSRHHAAEDRQVRARGALSPPARLPPPFARGRGGGTSIRRKIMPERLRL